MDKIVEQVITKFKERSEKGQVKYGTTLERDDLSKAQWLNHLQEELMDGILYIERLKEPIGVWHLSTKDKPEDFKPLFIRSILENITLIGYSRNGQLFDYFQWFEPNSHTYWQYITLPEPPKEKQ